MKWWGRLMSWFRSSDDRSRSAMSRLREAEQHENEAMDRMVRAGVEVAMNADTASEEIDKILHGMRDGHGRPSASWRPSGGRWSYSRGIGNNECVAYRRVWIGLGAAVAFLPLILLPRPFLFDVVNALTVAVGVGVLIAYSRGSAEACARRNGTERTTSSWASSSHGSRPRCATCGTGSGVTSASLPT